MTILNQIQQNYVDKKRALAVLIDPDKFDIQSNTDWFKQAKQIGVDFLLLGGSIVKIKQLDIICQQIKSTSNLPLILFPGSLFQLTKEADATLLLSLISGRNPDLLIGHHVIAAPLIKEMNLETIPTGYLLIDGGNPTAAHYISNTQPIPYDKPDIAAYTALAGEYLGLKMMYLDAGSGAKNHVSSEMIKAVRQIITLPICVGGGIRDAKTAKSLYRSGADILVIGTAFEKDKNLDLLREIAKIKLS